MSVVGEGVGAEVLVGGTIVGEAVGISVEGVSFGEELGPSEGEVQVVGRKPRPCHQEGCKEEASGSTAYCNAHAYIATYTPQARKQTLTNKRGPKRKNVRWSSEEEQALLECYAKVNNTASLAIGKKWESVKRLNPLVFKRRSAVDLKDKWRNMTLRSAQAPPGSDDQRMLNTQPLPEEARDRLKELMPDQFSAIERKQKKTENTQTENIKKTGSWSSEEVQALVEGLANLNKVKSTEKERKNGKWRALKKLHPKVFEGRSTKDLQDKWRNLTIRCDEYASGPQKWIETKLPAQLWNCMKELLKDSLEGFSDHPFSSF